MARFAPSSRAAASFTISAVITAWALMNSACGGRAARIIGRVDLSRKPGVMYSFAWALANAASPIARATAVGRNVRSLVRCVLMGGLLRSDPPGQLLEVREHQRPVDGERPGLEVGRDLPAGAFRVVERHQGEADATMRLGEVGLERQSLRVRSLRGLHIALEVGTPLWRLEACRLALAPRESLPLLYVLLLLLFRRRALPSFDGTGAEGAGGVAEGEMARRVGRILRDQPGRERVRRAGVVRRDQVEHRVEREPADQPPVGGPLDAERRRVGPAEDLGAERPCVR